MAKRTGKTHENLENELKPPPPARRASGVVEPVRTVSTSGPQARSGPIGISGGDFATPTARKRTTTQPRGLPVVGPAARSTMGRTPTPSLGAGAQPESPFMAGAGGAVGDAAAQLAAEAAAVRALDSGPLTPPPLTDDPGRTPLPERVEAVAPPVEAFTPPAEAFTPPAESVAAPSGSVAPAPDGVASLPEPGTPQIEGAAPTVEDKTPVPTADPSGESGAREDLPAFDVTGDLAAGSSEDRFSAPETPWPELAHQGAVLRARTPVPGAIPTDAMSDSGAAPREDRPEEPSDGTLAAVDGPAGHQEEAEVSGVDLELVEGTESAETLDSLPAEALGKRSHAAQPAAEPPRARTPRPAAAPPPIPAGSPRRKSGEMRAPEVPAAQVVASIVPATPPGAASLPEALAQRPRRSKRSKPWFEEVFDEDYLRTLPFMSADQTLREVEFIEASLGVKPGGQLLDVGCGYGRHAIELVQRGLDVTGLDLSLPLLLRAADEAQKRAMSVNFVHADMREMEFEKQFDGVYCMLTSFGYFDEETNLRVAEGMSRALKPGGRLLLDLVNRDYIVGDLPSRVWWEGNGCVVLEEVDFSFHTSRILTHRSIVFEDGRQSEQEISVRAYSLHEIGRLLRQAGFRVLDISGSLATRGHFFGGTSRSLLILAEKRTDDT
ncbi:MAG TPA: methyltransferase domain-containing protein [Polyangia bacterium]|nr:methyltransferase domain-containing protein [Polyangia bacterium]